MLTYRKSGPQILTVITNCLLLRIQTENAKKVRWFRATPSASKRHKSRCKLHLVTKEKKKQLKETD